MTSPASISTQSPCVLPSIEMRARRERLFEMLGQGQHLPGRAAARDHHLVGDRRLAGEIDRDDVLGLAVLEGLR